jgi:hypothetical protein
VWLLQTLVNILEGILKPENLSNKAEQGLFEMYFVFAAIWAFGGALVDKDGISYRRNFDKWWKQAWTTVKLPGKQHLLLSRSCCTCRVRRLMHMYARIHASD